ncbi:hypothetical protein HDV62DRAFT_372015 [Trichoderma sp. SZMC 28011]
MLPKQLQLLCDSAKLMHRLLVGCRLLCIAAAHDRRKYLHHHPLFFYFSSLVKVTRLPKFVAPLTLILGGVELAAEAVSCLSGVNRGLLELLLFSFTQLRRRSHQLLEEIEPSRI